MRIEDKEILDTLPEDFIDNALKDTAWESEFVRGIYRLAYERGYITGLGQGFKQKDSHNFSMISMSILGGVFLGSLGTVILAALV